MQQASIDADEFGCVLAANVNPRKIVDDPFAYTTQANIASRCAQVSPTWYTRVFHHRVVRARAVRTILENGPVAVPDLALIVLAWPKLIVAHASVDVGHVLSADPRGVFVAFETCLDLIVLRLDTDADGRHGDVQTIVALAG